MRNRLVRIVIGASLLLALRSDAQEIGYGFFALLHPEFPCEQALRAFESPEASGLSVLWGTFGDSRECLGRWNEKTKGRPRFLQIHLTNEACRRNKRCGVGELRPDLSVGEYNKRLAEGEPQLLQEVVERVRAVKAAVETVAFSDTTLLLSLGLEDNFTPRAADRMYETVKAEWPYEIVRNPVKGGERGAARYIERHGPRPSFEGDLQDKRCIANLDGVDIEFPHRKAALPDKVDEAELEAFLETMTRRCRFTFFWASKWQGLSGAPAFVPPRERKFTVPEEDVRYLESLLSKTSGR